MPLRFEDYLGRYGGALLRYAYVLTGAQADAEDLVQTALVRAYPRWRRISRMAAPHAYVRRIVTRCFIDWGRRPGRRERPTADIPERVDPCDVASQVAELDAIIRALRCLSPRQRAVLSLRHLLGLPDEVIARELGCSASTVRSHASRGLRRLQDTLSQPDLEVHRD